MPDTAPPSNSAIIAQLAALPTLPMAELWAAWDKHCPRRPPHANRRYLEARLAYRLQEQAYGGLSERLRRHLADCGEQHSRIKCRNRRGTEVHLMPGTVLLREFDAREYRVTVTGDGQYELDGLLFKSLSAAARHITGTQWNGPRFFGLRDGKGDLK